jgi:predicted RecA/RadA family phage recombinase
MRNFVSNGNSIQLIAPAAGVVGGQVYGVGSFVGIVVADAASGQQFTLKLEGEYSDAKKKNLDVWAVGDKLYYDSVTGELSKDNTKEFAGYASQPALAADLIGSILLKQ